MAGTYTDRDRARQGQRQRYSVRETETTTQIETETETETECAGDKESERWLNTYSLLQVCSHQTHRSLIATASTPKSETRGDGETGRQAESEREKERERGCTSLRRIVRCLVKKDTVRIESSSRASAAALCLGLCLGLCLTVFRLQ